MCKCSFGTSVCNNKQCSCDNVDKCSCEYNELIDEEICDYSIRFIWNPSNCECDKSYDIGQYLDYKDCKCRKKL